MRDTDGHRHVEMSTHKMKRTIAGTHTPTVSGLLFGFLKWCVCVCECPYLIVVCWFVIALLFVGVYDSIVSFL